MLMMAFAPFSIFPFAVLAPVGLLALLYQASPRRAFWFGFYFGVGFFGSGVYWVFISISRYGDVPDVLAFAITAALVSFLALFPAVSCYLANRYFQSNQRAKVILAFPALWVFSEWTRSFIFTGFPWLLLGYSQTNSPLKGYAPIFSVYGISLVLMVTSGLVFDAILTTKKREYFKTYINLLIVTALWIVGALLSLIPWTIPVGNPVSVSLVQGNIPQSLKWDPQNIALSFERYRDMTAPLWGKTDLIIWPEVAIPMPLEDAQSFVNKMSDHAVASHSDLIFGIPALAEGDAGYYNTLVSVGSNQSAYIKRQLVPFGEYIPFQKIMARALDFMNVPMSNMKAGPHNQKPMKVGQLTILPSICYEIAYPELSRTINPNVNLILTVTNDAWFGESTAQAQHLQMAAMRSMEMGRAGLFVSNDGITAIINDKGIIEEAAPTHIEYVLRGKIQPQEGYTPWMKNGFDPLLLILICMLGGVIQYQYKLRKKRT